MWKFHAAERRALIRRPMKLMQIYRLLIHYSRGVRDHPDDRSLTVESAGFPRNHRWKLVKAELLFYDVARWHMDGVLPTERYCAMMAQPYGDRHENGNGITGAAFRRCWVSLKRADRLMTAIQPLRRSCFSLFITKFLLFLFFPLISVRMCSDVTICRFLMYFFSKTLALVELVWINSGDDIFWY